MKPRFNNRILWMSNSSYYKIYSYVLVINFLFFISWLYLLRNCDHFLNYLHEMKYEFLLHRQLSWKLNTIHLRKDSVAGATQITMQAWNGMVFLERISNTVSSEANFWKHFRINSIYSFWLWISSCVPQNSILGPLLFNICIMASHF